MLFFNRKSFFVSLWSQTVPLLKPPHVIYFLTCCFMHFGTYCVGGGMALFLPEILNQLSNARTEDSGDLRVCQVIQMDKSNSSAVADGVSFHYLERMNE